jgi:hypothetical protein
MAVDDASPANTFVYDGSGWRSAGAIDSGNVVEAVSCASSSFCVAVDDNGGALTFNGSSWSGSVAIDGANQLYTVSCPSSSFCAAGDNASNVVTDNGGNRSVSKISGADGVGLVRSVSCPTPSFCAAALDTQNGNDAFFYGGGTWSDGGVDDSNSYEVASIACPYSVSGARLCLAVDGGGNYTYYNGQTWSAPIQIDSAALTSVSCSDPSFCVAVDDSGNALVNGSTSPPPQQRYTLTVTVAGSGRGSVSGSGFSCQTPCVHSQAYPAGTAVTLSASASAGSVFAG